MVWSSNLLVYSSVRDGGERDSRGSACPTKISPGTPII